MLPWKLQKRQILPVNQDLSSVYFSLARFQLVSCNLSLAMIWQMTFTHKLPKLCSATLNLISLLLTSYHGKDRVHFPSPPKVSSSNWTVSSAADVMPPTFENGTALLSMYVADWCIMIRFSLLITIAEAW